MAISTRDANDFKSLVFSAVDHAVQTAYPAGQRGMLKLSLKEQGEQVRISIRDFGPPQDVSTLNLKLHGEASIACVDEMRWQSHGGRGKSLEIAKWIHDHEGDGKRQVDAGPAGEAAAPLARMQAYEVRRMKPEEAIQVSQLMYLVYGGSYFNKDVYIPERIAAQNEQESLVSVVAVGEDGRVAGHCALERNRDGLVAEIGQAAVDPAHRGRGLLDRMKEQLEREARALGLTGWFADAVAVHTFTQQSNAHHGGHVCGVDLAISPKHETFLKIAEKQPQRVSCVLYFHWLDAPRERTLFVPARHCEILETLYKNLQCSLKFGEPRSSIQPHGVIAVTHKKSAALGLIRVEQIGLDTIHAIRHALRDLLEHSHVHVVEIELPLEDPTTAEVCTALELDGVSFTGIGPHFSPQGDVLKLAYLVKPLSREPIKTFEPIAAQLVDYALAEQSRVRQSL